MPDHFFTAPEPALETVTEETGGPGRASRDLPEEIFQSKNRAEDIANIRGMGLDVDDNNDPALENIPDQEEPTPLEGQEWGWEGLNHRKKHNFSNVSASLHGISNLTLKSISWVTIFLIFFSTNFYRKYYH